MQTQATPHHWAWHWGHRGAQASSNRSCGVSILLRRRRFDPKQVRRIATPATSLAGRAGGLRIKSGHHDFFVASVYYPTKGSARYREGVGAVDKWLSKQLSGTPARSLPIVGADLDDSLGMQSRDGGLVPTRSPAVGLVVSGVEGVAGASLRLTMEMHDLKALNTFVDIGDTFYGCRGTRSTIDFLLTAQWVQPSSMTMMHDAGRSPQLIAHHEARDHLPLHVCFPYKAEWTYTQKPSTWDFDKLGRGCQEGWQRREFLEALEGEMAEMEIDGDVDRGWRRMVTATQKVAHRFYGNDSKIDEAYRDDVRERTRLLEERRRARAAYTVYDEDQALRLRRLSARCRAARRAQVRAVRYRREDDLREAIKKRRWAEAWKICRLLAGRGHGPRKRRFLAAGAQLSDEEWREQLPWAPEDGGMAAEFCEEPEQEVNDVESVLQLRHIQAAEEDYLEMRRRVKHMPRRRAAPPWALPSEVLLMLLWPRRVRVRATTGLGMAPLPTPHRWQAALQRVLRDVHRAGRVPQQAQRSLGVTLDKGNGQLGVRGARIIHVFCCWWTSWHRKLYQRHADGRCAPDWAHGFEPSRRREDALVVTQTACHKLRREGCTHVRCHHDLTNAFACTNGEVLERALGRLPDGDGGYLRRRISEGMVTIRTA